MDSFFAFSQPVFGPPLNSDFKLQTSAGVWTIFGVVNKLSINSRPQQVYGLLFCIFSTCWPLQFYAQFLKHIIQYCTVLYVAAYFENSSNIFEFTVPGTIILIVCVMPTSSDCLEMQVSLTVDLVITYKINNYTQQHSLFNFDLLVLLL